MSTSTNAIFREPRCRSILTSNGLIPIRGFAITTFCVLFSGGLIAENGPSTKSKREPAPAELVQGLDATDVQWSVDNKEIGHVRLQAEAAKLVALAEPAFKELIAAADDPDRFIAAHCVLCALTSRCQCCEEIQPGGWLLHYGALQVSVERGDGRLGTADRVIIPDPEKQKHRISAQWSVNNFLDFEGELRRRHEELQKQPPRAGARRVTLRHRSREFVEKLHNEDVTWMHEKYCLPFPRIVLADSSEVRPRPSIEALLDGLNDPKRFVAAHILLCEEFQREAMSVDPTTDGYAVVHNGLRVDIVAKFGPKEQPRAFEWLISFPDADRQREHLVKRWEGIRGESGE